LLRVESQEVKSERVRGVPPGLLGPASVEALDLEIHGDLRSLKTAETAGLAELAPQFAIYPL